MIAYLYIIYLDSATKCRKRKHIANKYKLQTTKKHCT